jgi:beta-glucosidase
LIFDHPRYDVAIAVSLHTAPPFAQAGGRGAMLAHNSINQVPCHASSALMNWLRSQGNMSGALLASDMCDVGLLGPAGFRVTTGLEGSAALAMGAGLDQELCNAQDGRGQAYPLAPQAIVDGLLSQAALDRAAGNVLRAKFAAGLFDGRALVNNSHLPLLNSPAHRALARRTVAEGAVLLKNDGALLPLIVNASTRIAVIGPLAGCGADANATFDCVATRSQCGGYTNWGVDVVSVLAAAYNESFGANVVYVPGAAVGGNDTSGFGAAVAAAAAADVVVFVGGDSGGLGWCVAHDTLRCVIEVKLLYSLRFERLLPLLKSVGAGTRTRAARTMIGQI